MNWYDYIDDVIHLVDRDMKIIFCNRSIEKLSRGRIKRDDIIGKNLFDVFPFLIEKGVKEEYEKVFSEGIILKTEEWVDYHGEKIHTVTKKIPIMDEKGRVKRVLTIIKDVSELRRLEESFHDMIQRYSHMMEYMNEGVAITDAHGKIIYVNGVLVNILGWERMNIVGKNFNDVIGYRAKLDISNRFEIEIKTEKGSKYVLLSVNPLYRENKYMGSLNIILDITERKKAEEKMKEALEKEREFKMRTAHYFFNPLAIAKGYLGLLQESMPENENVEKALFAVQRVENVIMNIVKKGKIVEKI